LCKTERKQLTSRANNRQSNGEIKIEHFAKAVVRLDFSSLRYDEMINKNKNNPLDGKQEHKFSR
jgi:hypothetical protein